MIIVKHLLQQKGYAVYSVTSDTKVFDALSILVEKNIGSLAIIDNDKLSGIFSERDYARKVVLQGKSSRETPIADIMTPKVITVTEGDTINTCMELMSSKKIRHLIVVDDQNDQKVIGVLSISDIVQAIIAQQQQTIDHLNQYIQS